MVLCGHVSMSVASATKDMFPDKEQSSDSVCVRLQEAFLALNGCVVG